MDSAGTPTGIKIVGTCRAFESLGVKRPGRRGKAALLLLFFARALLAKFGNVGG